MPKFQKERKLAEVHRHNCGRSSRAEEAGAQVLDQVQTTGVKDAKKIQTSVHKRFRSAKTRFTKKGRERQQTKRCQKSLKHESESCKAPPDVQTGRSAHTCLSRGVPADHEVRSQVKEKRRAAAGVKAFRGSLPQKKD